MNMGTTTLVRSVDRAKSEMKARNSAVTYQRNYSGINRTKKVSKKGNFFASAVLALAAVTVISSALIIFIK